jgi:hypothetical protein
MEETKAQRGKRTLFFNKERTLNKTTTREANMSSADRQLKIE